MKGERNTFKPSNTLGYGTASTSSRSNIEYARRLESDDLHDEVIYLRTVTKCHTPRAHLPGTRPDHSPLVKTPTLAQKLRGREFPVTRSGLLGDLLHRLRKSVQAPPLETRLVCQVQLCSGSGARWRHAGPGVPPYTVLGGVGPADRYNAPRPASPDPTDSLSQKSLFSTCKRLGDTIPFEDFSPQFRTSRRVIKTYDVFRCLGILQRLGACLLKM